MEYMRVINNIKHQLIHKQMKLQLILPKNPESNEKHQLSLESQKKTNRRESRIARGLKS